MCRLFGQLSDAHRTAREPLCSAENALRTQSHLHPHGWGIAWYGAGGPRVRRGVMAAHADLDFVRAGRSARSRIVLAHVRDASVGRIALENTHPFVEGPWVFAHNGTVARYKRSRAVREALLAAISPARRRALRGETDSERCFQLFLSRLDLRAGRGRATVADVRTALAYEPPHLSIYQLTIEQNTLFAKHPPALPDDDASFDMLDRITALTAERGLERYEVSAYARPGHRCRHNLNYWEFGDYLGIGAGAHGKLSFPHRVLRQVRWRDPERYMAQALAGRAVAQEHEVARSELPFEFMLNALRLKEGFELARFTERTGLALSALEPALADAERRGLVACDLQRVRPTERGFDLLSDLQALFLHAR